MPAARGRARSGRDPGPFLSSIPGSAGCPCWPRSARCCPNAPIVYAADSAGFPYGTKSAAEIAARVPACSGGWPSATTRALIVIACNTASTIALQAVRAAVDSRSSARSRDQARRRAFEDAAIGVLGTEATIRQPYVDRLAAEFAPMASSSATAPPSWSSSPRPSCAASRPIRPLTPASDGLLVRPGGERIDTVVLACTHFPLVATNSLQRRRGRSPSSTAMQGSPGASPG